MQNLRLQQKLIAVVLIPAVLLLLIAVGGLFFSGDSGVATGLGIFALLGAIACAVLGFVLVSPIVRAADKVRDAAVDLCDRRLPAMENGEESPFGFEQLEIRPTGDGQFDDIAASLENIHSYAASSFYEQQERVREGLSKVVVNLARRNQNLLDRQLDLVDEMEESEQNPDRLDQLFTLDHMATRMKRNQESLLVLADAESPRRRSGQEEIEDVIQVAMGEVEDYTRIEIQKVQPVFLSGTVAGDLAHLTSELLENACSFSPPESKVIVTGVTDEESGSYAISIADEGVGMSAEQLSVSNKLLIEPPDLGLNMGRSLGFAVVGKLAERLEVEVTLVSNPGGKGTTAVIEIPASLISTVSETEEDEPVVVSESDDGETSDASEPADDTAPLADPLARFRQDAGEKKLAKLLGADGTAPVAEEVVEKTEAPAWVPPTVTPKAPEKLADAVPTGEEFDDGLEGLLDQEDDSGKKPLLTRRAPGEAKPKANVRDPAEAKAPAASESEKKTKASSRKPDEIRSMLSKYREGIKSKDES